MTMFVDTSALYALLNDADANHDAATELFKRQLEREEDLLTSNFVLLETATLVQRRMGLRAVRVLHEQLVPVLRVEWLERQAYEAAMATLLAAERRQVSLIDWTSFQLMRRDQVKRAFTFDGDFAAQGFNLVP